MARPRKFEREPMLNQALEVFWSKGYEATSVQDLVDALGVHPGTLYATLGDKHTLFLDVLDHYDTRGRVWITATLERPGPKKEAIQRLFSIIVEGLLSPTGQRGCLLVNTAVERALCDAAAMQKVTQHQVWLEDILHRTLREAHANGELPAYAPEELRALAQYLHSNLHGLRVVAKTATEPQVLRDIARLALATLE